LDFGGNNSPIRNPARPRSVADERLQRQYGDGITVALARGGVGGTCIGRSVDRAGSICRGVSSTGLQDRLEHDVLRE
jgi:hypothetical protein